MADTIIEAPLGDRFEHCPGCGYRAGFHSVFRRLDETVKWLLICPSCHDTYDIGLTARIEGAVDEA